MVKVKQVSTLLLKTAGEPNANGHTFSKECLESIHRQIQENKGRVLGELGQTSDRPQVNFANAVSVVQDSTLDGDKLFVNIQFIKEDLPTELLRPALRFNVKDEDMKNKIIHDLQLIAVDMCRKEDLE